MQKSPPSKILILDFGSQTTQLIARRIRSFKVYAEILPFNTPIEEIKAFHPKAIIFSGGPQTVRSRNAPKPSPEIYSLGVPILGICYGLQLITHQFSGLTAKGSKNKEFGKADLCLASAASKSPLLEKVSPKRSVAWMSHTDEIKKPPKDFEVLGKTKHSPYAIIGNEGKNIYAVQFHPEVSHSVIGNEILKNFVFKIANCKADWNPQSIIKEMIKEVKKTVGNRQVLHAISGGVDSTVMAAILHKALGKKVKCVMVDTGFLRKDEVNSVQKRFKKYLKTEVEVIDAKESFIRLLKNVTSGQRRRELIGKEYVDIFLKKLKKGDFLSQGTLYPDVIESAAEAKGPANTIKTHHNRVKEILELMEAGRVIEIFKDLFKDEVRLLGKELGLPKEIVARQPFPGPGLAVRILGKISASKLKTLKEADAIVIEELKKAGLYYKISQTVVALDSNRATCVRGDMRGSGYPIFIRNIATNDFMTASVYDISPALRKRIADRVLNEVDGTARVLFDESSKPPATICYL